MRRRRFFCGAIVVAAMLQAPAAPALEIHTPPITAATAVGEWVAHWHGPEEGNLILLSFDLSSALSGMFTRAHTTGDVFGYAITQVKVDSGTLQLDAMGTGTPGGAKLLVRGTGRASPDEGWIDATVTETTPAGPTLEFRVRFEKGPDKVAAQIRRMLAASRRVRKGARGAAEPRVATDRAAGALRASTAYSRRDVERLRKAPAFSGIVGDGGCLTKEGAAFVRVYGARDAKPFSELARGATPAAKLFALCGLQHLNAPDAADLRARLSSSKEKTRLLMGCVVPPRMEVGEFFLPSEAGSETAFDEACEILIRHDPAKLSVTTCGGGRG